MSLNKISICIFTCDKYKELWDINVFLVHKHIPKEIIDEVFLITDLPSDVKICGATIICSNDNNNFIKRLQCGARHCKTQYFLFLLDDYFISKNVSLRDLNNLLEFVKQKNSIYCKLFLRNIKTRKKLAKYNNLKIDEINSNIQYAIDLYPAIWDTSFVVKMCNYWDFGSNTIWDVEARLTEQVIRFKEAFETLLCAEHIVFFLDVIRKGKVIRRAYRSLKRDGIVIQGRQKRTVHEAFLDHLSVFLSHWLPSWLKKRIKKRMKKRGYRFYSD